MLGVGEAANGIVAAATGSDRGEPGDDGNICPPAASTSTPAPSCVKVDMRRGKWTSNSVSSWAVAKLAGYAAILRQAFPSAGGADLVRIIEGGANGDNVFDLAAALTNEGLAGIGNGQTPYDSAEENPDGAGGSHAGRRALAGWTRLALAGPSGPLPLVRKGAAAFAAFGTLDGVHPAGAGPRAVGIEAAWKGLSWGLLAERGGFLGRPRSAVLGAASGRWTWAGWNGSAALGGWTFGIGLEAGIGAADAARSAVVADYGTLLTTAWALRAERRTEGPRAWAQVRQPPRVERARIRLRHGEGTVRERNGRELRWSAGIRTGGWTLSAGVVQEPGHDARRKAGRTARLEWRTAW